MTERGGAIIFCRILEPALMPRKAPPPSPDATILNYLNDRERGRHNLLYDFSARINASQCAPSPDVTIFNYLNDRERGRHNLLCDFSAPSPDVTILDYLDDREGGAIICVGFLRP